MRRDVLIHGVNVSLLVGLGIIVDDCGGDLRWHGYVLFSVEIVHALGREVVDTVDGVGKQGWVYSSSQALQTYDSKPIS